MTTIFSFSCTELKMAAGLRVIRGPDWNLNDDDGGEGHVGTLRGVGGDGKTTIVWDGGQVTACRGGQGQGHDLRVLDNATVGELKNVFIKNSFVLHIFWYFLWRPKECFLVL